MTLSVDDEITLVELTVIAFGIAVTWLIYRRDEDETGPPLGTSPSEGQEARTPPEVRSTTE
jgi:hypothetical protein